MRSARYPRGFPSLSPREKNSVREANVLVEFASMALATHLEADERNMALLGHPEDLGARRNGRPASTWAWPEVRALTKDQGCSVGRLPPERFWGGDAQAHQTSHEDAGCKQIGHLGGPHLR